MTALLDMSRSKALRVQGHCRAAFVVDSTACACTGFHQVMRPVCASAAGRPVKGQHCDAIQYILVCKSFNHSSCSHILSPGANRGPTDYQTISVLSCSVKSNAMLCMAGSLWHVRLPTALLVVLKVKKNVNAAGI